MSAKGIKCPTLSARRTPEFDEPARLLWSTTNRNFDVHAFTTSCMHITAAQISRANLSFLSGYDSFTFGRGGVVFFKLLAMPGRT